MSITAGLILILTGILVLHLIEEVKTGFRKKLPFGEMPKPVFIGVNILVYSFCLATFLLLLAGSGLAIPFAWVFSVGMLLNGLGHIAIMIPRRKYFPGGLTAFVLVSVAVYTIIHLASV